MKNIYIYKRLIWNTIVLKNKSIVAKHDIKDMQTNILILIFIQWNPVKTYNIVEKKTYSGYFGNFEYQVAHKSE